MATQTVMPPAPEDADSAERAGSLVPVATRRRRFAPSRSAVVVNLSRLAIVAAVVGIWQLATSLGWMSKRYFSDPATVATELGHAYRGDGFLGPVTIYADIAYTMKSVLIGYLIGAVCAILVGYPMGRSPLFNALGQPYVTALAGIPKIALVPILILIFGLGSDSAITSAAIMVFIGVVYTTSAGVRDVNPDYIALARLMGAGRLRVSLTVVLPAALPSIVIGLRAAVPLGLIGGVTAEFLGSTKGLGYAVQQSGNTYDTAALFIVIITLLVITFVLGQVLALIQWRILRWQS